MAQYSQNHLLKTFGQIAAGIAVVIVLTLIADAFTQPTQAPPGGNVSASLNTSATAQTKTGNLTLPLFYDYNNTGYYVDPDANSIFYRIYGMADIRAPIFYDQNNTSYFVDPAGTSRLGYGDFDNENVRGTLTSGAINLGGVSRTSWPSTTLERTVVSCSASAFDSSASCDAICPSGYQAVGGGKYQLGTAAGPVQDSSYPVGNNIWRCSGWENITCYAVCLKWTVQ